METVTVEPINVSVTNQGDGNISRHHLLIWLNNTVVDTVEKIEDMSTGVLYCKMLNELFQDSIAMGKIKRHPQHDHEKQYNLKLLQYAFHDLGIQKQIDVEKISRARFHDNFEFLQWFRKFYIVNYENIKEASKYGSQVMKCRSHRSLQNCRQYSHAEFFKRSRTAPALTKQKTSLQLLQYNSDLDETLNKYNGEQETVSALANDLEQYEHDYNCAENDIERKILERRIYHKILSRIETLLKVQVKRYEVLRKAFEVLDSMTPNDGIYSHNVSLANTREPEEFKYAVEEEDGSEDEYE